MLEKHVRLRKKKQTRKSRRAPKNQRGALSSYPYFCKDNLVKRNLLQYNVKYSDTELYF